MIEEWSEEGVLQESTLKSSFEVDGVEYQMETSIKLSTFSIPGFPFGFLSIAMVLGVTSLLFIRKRTN